MRTQADLEREAKETLRQLVPRVGAERAIHKAYESTKLNKIWLQAEADKLL